MDILTLGRLYFVIQCIDNLVTLEIDSYAEHIYYIVGYYFHVITLHDRNINNGLITMCLEKPHG